MFNTVKNVIAQGGYNLKDLLHKIDVLWAKGKLTDEEYEALVTSAREGAKFEHGVDVFAKLEELDKRIAALEKGNTGEGAPTEEPLEYEAGVWYYRGDVCSFEGKVYVCAAPEGVACVWSPSEYPAYWELNK